VGVQLGREELFEEFLVAHRSRLDDVADRFDTDRTATALEGQRQWFPTTTGPDRPELRRFEDYPALVPCLLLTWELQERIPRFQSELREDIRSLTRYFDGERTARGKQLYTFLVDGRWSDSEVNPRDELEEWIDSIETELEANPFPWDPSRSIDQHGFPITNPIECLQDFDRTFPFLRALCVGVPDGASVLEFGVGTGILSFSSVLAGAETAVGIELNPLTCLLARRIRSWLYDVGAIPDGTITILWGDAFEFGVTEYPAYADEQFDVLIVENISTGLFTEYQLQLIAHAARQGLVETCGSPWRYESARITTPVVPSSMVTSLELVELDEPLADRTDVVLSRTDLTPTPLTDEYPYAEFDFTAERSPAIVSTVRCRVHSAGRIDAITIFDRLQLGPGDYLGRDPERFLGSDVLLSLATPLSVEIGDRIVCGLAYETGDEITDAVVEVTRATDTESTWTSLDIDPEIHRRNRQQFADRTGLEPSFDLLSLPAGLRVRSEVVHDGRRHLVFTDLASGE
jgi:hypothetical protein